MAPTTQKIVVRNNFEFQHSRAGVFFKGNSDEEIRAGKREVRTLIIDPRIDEAQKIADEKERTAALVKLNYAHGLDGEAIGVAQLERIANDPQLSVSLASETIDIMTKVSAGLQQAQAPEAEAPADSPKDEKPASLVDRFQEQPDALTTSELKALADGLGIALKSVKKTDIIDEIKKAIE